MKKLFLGSLLALMLALVHPLGYLKAEYESSRVPSVETSVAKGFKSSKMSQEQSLIMGAMKRELDRSMAKLSLDDYPSPYFISYLIRDKREVSVTARYGAIFSFSDSKYRPSHIEVRVGTHELDNSDKPSSAWRLDHGFPVDNDAAVIENRLWILTDLLYKKALAEYMNKKGKRAFKADEKVKVNDFSFEDKQDFVGAKASLAFDKEHWFGVLRRVSEVFLKHPELVYSQIEFDATEDTKYLVNSEGTTVVEGNTYYAIEVWAGAWSEDGMPLAHSVRYSCRDAGELPSETKMKSDIDEMISELKLLRQTEEIKPCTVPAIFDPEMSSVLFHEAMGHRLEGDRQREDKEGHTFKNKVGEKVLPEFLTLIDNPTLPEYANTTLFGHYLYDDQGVPGQKTILVEDGVLKNYLMSRRPIENFDNSNGHGRVCAKSGIGASLSARMANLQVHSKNELSRTDLEQRLIDECKKRGLDCGLIFVGTLGGHTNTDTYNYQAFLGKPKLVYKLNVSDGTRELVRGVNIVGTPLNTLEKVIATGNDYAVYNGYCGAESGMVPVSGIAPSILLSEIEIQRIPDEKSRPPILLPPAFDR